MKSLVSNRDAVAKTVFIFGAILLMGILATSLYTFKSNYAVARQAFNAENIMSDQVMRHQSMTTAEIQRFLDSKGVECTSGNNCLKNYRQNGKNASQIIYEIGQQYRINPQVLIVLLQKEAGLVTINNPATWRYNSATGYGCPDSTPGVCNSTYLGFTNQLRWAATMFDAILRDSPTWYAPYIVGSNRILYHPHNDCGTQRVNIKNRATAALYSYTPYVPNRAALNAGYGTGDRCSSYGNRNFFNYYTDWFGDPLKEADYTQPSISSPTFSVSTLLGSAPAKLPKTGNFGEYISTLNGYNSLNIFYYNETSKTLNRAWYASGKWRDGVVDGSSTTAGRVTSDVGKYITSLYDSDNRRIHLFYHNATNGSIRHAEFNELTSTWNFTSLEGPDGLHNSSAVNGVGISAALSDNGTLHVSYYDNVNGILRHASRKANGSWSFRTLDGSNGSASGRGGINTGMNPSMFTRGDDPHVYYYDKTNGNLRHAWLKNNTWSFETMDGSYGSISGWGGVDTGMEPHAFLKDGNHHIYYYDVTNRNLRHAWLKNGAWRFETINGSKGSRIGESADVGMKPHVATLRDITYVFYYNETSSAWSYATLDANGWNDYDLDGTYISQTKDNHGVGGMLQGAFYDNGQSLHLFYGGSSENIVHAWTRGER